MLEKVTVHAAIAVRAVGDLDAIETICALPLSVTCVSRGWTFVKPLASSSRESRREDDDENKRRCRGLADIVIFDVWSKLRARFDMCNSD